MTESVGSSRSRIMWSKYSRKLGPALGKVAIADAEQPPDAPPLGPERLEVRWSTGPTKRMWERMIESASVACTHAYGSGSSEWYGSPFGSLPLICLCMLRTRRPVSQASSGPP